MSSETVTDKLTVLISDDDPMIREVLREVLDAEPDLAVVAVGSDAEEAIALAERHAPAIAILDVRMPAGGGARAAREILRRSPGTRILAFSAYDEVAAVEEMRSAGVTEYVVKGVPNAEIVTAVRRLRTS
jgi:DNA-binding NarL/FixJ family response regulator